MMARNKNIPQKAMILLLAALFLLATLFAVPARVLAMAPEESSPAPQQEKSSSDPDEPEFSEDRVVVKFHNNARTRSLQAKGDSTPELGIEYTEMRVINPSKNNPDIEGFSTRGITDNRNNMYVLLLREEGEEAVEEAVETLNANPAVEWAEPDYLYEVLETPNDPYYDAQYALESIDAPQAWDITTGSKEVVVGIIDTGIKGDHPEIAPNLWENPNPNQGGYVNDIHGYDFYNMRGGIPTDNHVHGTHVSGILGAKGNNGRSIAGVNWDVSLAWLGTGDDRDYISGEAAVSALYYAADHDIMITNNSYGSYLKSRALETAIEDYPGLFIAAAGNDSADIDGRWGHYPACYDLPNIISVASVDNRDYLSSYSNYGATKVDLAAPGSSVYSIHVNNHDGYDIRNGTSMAAPYVAGVAALVKAENPDMTTAQLKERLLQGVENLPSLAGKVATDGRLNAYYALNPRPAVQSISIAPDTIALEVNESTTLSATILPAGANQAVKWELTDGEDVVRLSPNGRVLALTAGTATISGKAYGDQTKTAVLHVTVTDNGENIILFRDDNFKQGVIEHLQAIDSAMYGSYTVNTNLYASDLEKIISLDVRSRELFDLEGLQYFVNLETLICYENELDKLDVSKNIKLTELNCQGNQLTTLDVHNNLLLVRLICFDNLLGELDVSKNTALSYLTCSSNGFSEIDVSNNLLLEYFNCSNNQLQTLDVSKNTVLTSLSCTQNELSGLDISKNTVLTRLLCSQNKLTELNANNNLLLEYLDARLNPIKQIKATLSGNPVTVSVNGNGYAELYWYASTPYVNATPEGNNVFVDWTNGGAPFSSEQKIELERGTGYALVANFRMDGPLAAPQNLSASAGDKKAILSWTAPNEDGGSAITGYEVSSDNGKSWIATGNKTGHTFTKLTNGQRYTFKVRAINEKGKGAVASIAATPLGVPSAPQNLKASAGDSQISLSWSIPSDNGGSAVNGYKVSSDNGKTWTNVDGKKREHTFSGLTNGKSYTFKVCAVNKIGNSSAASIKAAPKTKAKPSPTKTPAPTKVIPDGWHKEASAWYYYQNGKVIKGWKMVEGVWYYLGSKGNMLTGWMQLGNTWYYLAPNGAMVNGYHQIGGRWSSFSAGGSWQGYATNTGWQRFAKGWSFKASGQWKYGWQKVNSAWYYLDSQGYMKTGWVQSGNSWYYMKASGAMAEKEWQKIGAYWYWFVADGKMITGEIKIDGRISMFNGSGQWLGYK